MFTLLISPVYQRKCFSFDIRALEVCIQLFSEFLHYYNGTLAPNVSVEGGKKEQLIFTKTLQVAETFEKLKILPVRSLPTYVLLYTSL